MASLQKDTEDTSLREDKDEGMSRGTQNGLPIAYTKALDASGIPEQVPAAPSDPEMLLAFYSRLFPWRTLFQWLNHTHKPTVDFSHREFAFTLHNDAYLRYQSFLNFESLRKEVLKLNPSRFEIGPVYSANPRDRKTLSTSAFRPVEKELVFDIDLTDYDDIRTCCSKVSICGKCWQFIIMAIKVLDSALRDDFNFQHILWVYSGRRGVHGWICDRKARKFDDSKRRAIAAYLEIIKGGGQSGKRVNVKRPLHPHVSRSLDILKDSFLEDILELQDPWYSPEQAERLLALLPDRQLNDALRKKWEIHSNRSSKSKWDDIDALAMAGVSNLLNTKNLVEAKQDIILEYTYPRLDLEVSKHLNHLLKSPFCVHPGTGRVCVPIDPTKLDVFDPQKVPTIAELLLELNKAQSGTEISKQQNSSQDYERTGLKNYIDFFKTFVQRLMEEELRSMEVKSQDQSMDFKTSSIF